MKENESVLSVLMYLFHHHMNKKNEIDLNDMQLADELRSAGFHSINIGKAFRWLHNLAEFSDSGTHPSAQSFRVFSEQECWLMDTDCRNFICSLEHQGILTPHARELVIHQTLELLNEGVDLNLLKWVTLMVLFNLPNSEKALAHMESLVLNNAFDTQH